MKIEEISKVAIVESGEMYITLSSGGNPMYQHIYREGAEVYWDLDNKAFKAPIPRKWSYPDWFNHVVRTVASGLSVSLKLCNTTSWENVPTQIKAEICSRETT